MSGDAAGPRLSAYRPACACDPPIWTGGDKLVCDTTNWGVNFAHYFVVPVCAKCGQEWRVIAAAALLPDDAGAGE